LRMTTGLDVQTEYWDGVARTKSFSIPLDMERFLRIVPKTARILDYGCGYGRTCAELSSTGYTEVAGVDISGEMIRRGLETHPGLRLQKIVPNSLPYPDSTFDAVILFAVLTCIPTDDGQRALIDEIRRVLRPQGILYVSDFLIQQDERNQARYRHFEGRYGRYGVFELPEGAVLRHHLPEWIGELLRAFKIFEALELDVTTMNAHHGRVFQHFARKIS